MGRVWEIVKKTKKLEMKETWREDDSSLNVSVILLHVSCSLANQRIPVAEVNQLKLIK